MSTLSQRSKQRQLKWLRQHRSLRPFDFTHIAFPVIQNMAHPPIGLEDLIAVQPMQEPAGEVMYLDIVYGPPRPVPPGAIVELQRRLGLRPPLPPDVLRELDEVSDIIRRDNQMLVGNGV